MYSDFSLKTCILLLVPTVLLYTECCVSVCVCVCVCYSICSGRRLVDASAGATQEEGHTEFFIHLPSAVRALIFLARRIQPPLSLVDREEIPVRVTVPRFELTSRRQKVSRLPTEPPGRPTSATVFLVPSTHTGAWS